MKIGIKERVVGRIKKAKFTIANFTRHKGGVYFESGYALGRGQQVIYTCKSDDIENAYFDTRGFQHIVWETTTDLKKQLINKINAVILE